MEQAADHSILKVSSLHKQFPVYGSFGKLGGAKAYVNAVSDVSLQLNEGETYGLVGESGSGKSTTGRTILGLTPASQGQVLYRDRELAAMTREEMRNFRKDVQLVFQDPFSSLNPRKRIGRMLEEPLIIHKMGDKAERQETVFQILKTVGLQPEHAFRFPHEFSGGQRQRLGLARALIMNPKIIVCDEPVSALDVSIQSQILNMLKRLQREMKLTLLFITHDISVVRYISDRIGIMYLGKIMEEALTDDLFHEPLHPYTKALFSAVPDFNRSRLKERIMLRGEIPSPISPPSGCVFHTRCPYATDVCRTDIPAVREVRPGHKVACHLVD
ncbi:oligopeptide/dipeptide ABC transporter ATP-binding protein [Paenibacillus sp. FSL H8-0457]|uniref:ABC transporter ATP-binding protein n=1 Tax=unclassified Paenibacillus TaxID=185978 RepID=UPI0003E1F02A|nr:oligopeptide/dipeptide ABC transporter ATP-binding protein [Paenibacillus sp. FSL H8-457]ETT60036.1 oligopeptide/dipeptide ABC transporter ATPase subunit [Paenibacillus sp. FSL H8-457]